MGLVTATNRNRFQAVEFLAKIDARNGTEMAQPLTQGVNELNALAGDRKTSAERDRILVLVTDGQVGNEDQILRDLGKQLKNVRVFTLGIDRAVNAAFLKRLSDLGGGATRLVESEDRLDEVMDDVHRHIGTAVLTNLRLEPAGLAFVPGSIVPSRLPDLFAGSPLTIMGRYTGSPQGAIALQARDAAGKMWQAEVKASRATSAAPATVWARGRLREMEDRYVVANDPALAKEIVATSLRFGVLCRFTAFVAVDRASVANPGGQVHGIVQPVEEPEGWEMGGRMLACAAAMPMYFSPVDAEMCDAAATTDYDEVEVGSFTGQMRKRKVPRANYRLPPQVKSPAPSVPMSTADFLQRLSTAGTDAKLRREMLQTILAPFEQLVTVASASGQHPDIAKRLDAALQQVRQLLGQKQVKAADVHAVWDEVVAALTEYQAATSGAPPASRQENFWA
jgi:Ca-activated chloride channel family protein